MIDIEARCAVWEQRRQDREREAFVRRLVRRRQLERRLAAGER
jgi:hypothetical protein